MIPIRNVIVAPHRAPITSRTITSRNQSQRGAPSGVTDGDDIGLDGRIRDVTRIPSSHETFVEISASSVGVVSTGRQDDGALFAHGLVAVRVRWRPSGEAKSRRLVHDGTRARVVVETQREGGRGSGAHVQDGVRARDAAVDLVSEWVECCPSVQVCLVSCARMCV